MAFLVRPLSIAEIPSFPWAAAGDRPGPWGGSRGARLTSSPSKCLIGAAPGLPAPGLPRQLLCLLCPRGGSTESHELMKGLLRATEAYSCCPGCPGFSPKRPVDPPAFGRGWAELGLPPSQAALRMPHAGPLGRLDSRHPQARVTPRPFLLSSQTLRGPQSSEDQHRAPPCQRSREVTSSPALAPTGLLALGPFPCPVLCPGGP